MVGPLEEELFLRLPLVGYWIPDTTLLDIANGFRFIPYWALLRLAFTVDQTVLQGHKIDKKVFNLYIVLLGVDRISDRIINKIPSRGIKLK